MPSAEAGHLPTTLYMPSGAARWPLCHPTMMAPELHSRGRIIVPFSANGNATSGRSGVVSVHVCAYVHGNAKVNACEVFTLSIDSVTKGRGTSRKGRANQILAVWIYARVFRLVRLYFSTSGKSQFFFTPKKKESQLRRDALYTVWLFLRPVDPGTREERRGRVPEQAAPLQRPGLQHPETGVPSEEEPVRG